MFSKVNSIGLFGLGSYSVGVEASTESLTMPKFDLVGLPDAAVSESRDRVRAAMKNNKMQFPVGRITVNLSPADKKKEGPMYDVPILIALLIATGQLSADVSTSAFFGELSLGGKVRKVNGALPMAIHARESGIKDLYVPLDNASECAVVDKINIYPVENITQLIDHLRGRKRIKKIDKRSLIMQASIFLILRTSRVNTRSSVRLKLPPPAATTPL